MANSYHSHFLMFFSLCCLMLATSCQSTKIRHNLEIAGLEFFNNTNSAITDIKLSVDTSQEFVSCNYLMPHSPFSTTFPIRQYKGNTVTLSYFQRNEKLTVGPISVESTDDLVASGTVFVRITFLDNGRLAAQFHTASLL